MRDQSSNSLPPVQKRGIRNKEVMEIKNHETYQHEVGLRNNESTPILHA